MIGLDLPMLDNSARAIAADLGAKDLSLGVIMTRAAIVEPDFSFLALKATTSAALSAWTVTN